jgi:ribosomal protein L11 methyltransferase
MMPEENSTKWFAYDVTVEPAASDAVEHALNELDALGTEINHLRRKDSDRVTVVGYFNVLPAEDTVRDQLDLALDIFGLERSVVHEIGHREVEDQDWLSEWKKHWQPSVIGRFVVAPPWSDVTDEDKIVIRIEPNMAFGTGTHETTQLSLRAIEDNYRPEQSLLDVGTGTGVLAIAAAKLGRGQAQNLACDTDRDSVSIARENAVLNGVDEFIEFYVGSIEDETHVFDFVCANLTIDVILPLLPLLIAKSSDVLLLSGILADQESMITEALKHSGVARYDIGRAGEWISVVVRR